MNNKNLLMLMLLIFNVNLNAAEYTWANAFPIYTYGDVSSIASIYEFIHSIVSDPLPMTVFAIGFTFTAVWGGWKARDGDYGEILKAILAPVTLYALFFAPTVNVHITDLRVDKGLINYSTPDGGYKKVEEVPLAIAFVPASTSLLVSVFIDFIDNNWDSVSVGNRFSTLGFQEMSRISQTALIISQLEDLNSSLSGTVYNMSRYVNKCLVIEALKIPTNHSKLVKPSKVFPEMFDPANFDGGIANVEVSFSDASNNPITGLCSELYSTYVSGVATEIEDGLADILASRFPNVDTNSATFNEAWRENSGVQQAIVGNIREAMVTTAASRALARDLNTEGIGVNGVSMATEIEIEKTIANLRTEGLAKYEWTARMLPNAINILLLLMLGVFPLMIMVMSFVGFNAAKGVANFFMGYIAMNFNLVSLALVSNIISFYTAQNAQQAIVSYTGMPFGSTQLSDFMFQQADMAGLAGLIGAVSVPFITAAIFYGETKGLAAGMSAVSGAFRGNVGAGAKDALVERDAQAELDKQMLTDAQEEKSAAAWLTQEGIAKPSNMSAVEAQNQFMKNLQSIGNANAGAEIFHSGNAQNFISGAGKQASQGYNKTAGFGAHEVSMETAGSVAFEDGEVMGSMINKTADLRGDSKTYNTEDVGEGQAIGMFGKDMGSIALANLDSNANATVANASNAVASQVGAGRGLLETGAFNNDGTLANNKATEALIEGAALSAAQKASEQIGAGATGNMQDFLDKGLMDGSRGANATNRASQIMKDGVDKNGEALYDEDRAALGQAMNEVAGHNKNMQTADAANFGRTGEVRGVGDFISGVGAQARIAANDAMGTGEKWQDMNEAQKIADMAKVKENSARKTFGAIRGANAELHADGRSVDDAIADDVTAGTEKGVGNATHADNLRDKYNNNLKGTNDKSMTLSETMGAIDMSKLDSQEGQGAGFIANKAMGVDYSDNAMYGEMSKQQSTKAKLDAQGGVDGAVAIDVTEASIKAGTQMGSVEQSSKILEDAIKSGAADGAKTLSDAAAKVAEVQTGSQMGTTAGLMKKFSDPEALKKTLEDSGYKDAAKELDGMSAGDMASWVASKQAGHMTGMHGLALRNDKGEMTSVGVSLGDDGARAMTVDSSFKEDSSRSKTSGSTETFNNDVKKLNNTDPLATLAMNRFDGNMQKAAEYARSADGAKWMMDPRNELSVVAAEAGHHIAEATGMSGEGAALVAGGLAGGGLGLAISNKMTKEPIKFKENQLSQLSQIADDDGNIKGYEDSKGNRVADKDGYAVNKSGKRVESGNVGRAIRSSKNFLNEKGRSLISDLSSNSLDETVQSSTNNQDNKNNNSTSNHNKSPNLNSEDSISKNHDQTKLSKTGVVTPAPNVVGEARPNLGDPLKTPGTIKPSGTALDNKNFFEKRMSALSSVWDGGGSMKTKIAMSAGAIALGSTSAMASNMMDAVDPMAHISGTSLGDSSYGGDEAKQIMANKGGYRVNQNPSSFVNPNDMKIFNQAPSSIPQHAQQAFSQASSTGLNTNAAGVEIYSANKDDKLYTKSTDRESIRQLEDINLGAELGQDGIIDAVERLMEADRNRTEE